jgi:hypothetical protein
VLEPFVEQGVMNSSNSVASPNDDDSIPKLPEVTSYTTVIQRESELIFDGPLKTAT